MGNGGRIVVAARTLGTQTDDTYLAAIQASGYSVELVAPGQPVIPVLGCAPAIAACFQFDHPDLPGLGELRLVKERVPSVPIIMITETHSESLAVWAFRARVWDYFVQPVDMTRLLAVLAVLEELQSRRDAGARAMPAPAMPPNIIPPEARLRGYDGGDELAVLDRAVAYVDRHLHQRIVQAEIAALCGLSPFQFSRLFKRRYGTTFQEYVLRRRMEAAKSLLRHPGASVTDVCFSVGFRDLPYFTRTFQRYVGLPPSQYRLVACGGQAPRKRQAPAAGREVDTLPARAAEKPPPR